MTGAGTAPPAASSGGCGADAGRAAPGSSAASSSRSSCSSARSRPSRPGSRPRCSASSRRAPRRRRRPPSRSPSSSSSRSRWAIRVFAGTIRPLADLGDAAERLADGEPDVRVTPRGPGPVRGLAASFNAMAERLDRSRDDRRALLADVTHELRTPLTVVAGGIEAMLDGVHPMDEDHLAPLLAETAVMDRLLDDLRTLVAGRGRGAATPPRAGGPAVARRRGRGGASPPRRGRWRDARARPATAPS